MSKSMKTALWLLAACAYTVSTSCNSSLADDSGELRNPAEIRSALMSYDFAGDLAQCGFSVYDDPATHTLGYDESLARRVREFIDNGQVPNRPLTMREKQRLGRLKLPGKPGHGFAYPQLIIALRQHYLETGEYAESALDLFPELQTQAGYAAFLSMPVAERVRQYGIGINPITGRFYSSFQDQSWTPGGIRLTYIDDPVVAQERFPNMRIPLDPTKPMDGSTPLAGAWLIHIYGEEPGTDLFDETCWW